MLRSAMWDVGNEYLYLTVEAEGSGKTVAPSGLIEDGDAVSEAKHGALRDFQGGLLARTRALRSDAPTSARPSSPPQATLSPAPRN